MAINLNYSNSSTHNWTKEYMVEVLTGGSKPLITDPQVVNAFLRVDRADFVPEAMKYLAYNDVSIDIGNNEKLEKPTFVARMLAYLRPKFGGKYLVLGTASGYTTALISFIASDQGKVYSIEKYNLIFDTAKTNLTKYPHTKNVELVLKNSDDGLISSAPYDGILASYQVNYDALKLQLKDNGILVAPTNASRLVLIQKNSVNDFEEETIDLSD